MAVVGNYWNNTEILNIWNSKMSKEEVMEIVNEFVEMIYRYDEYTGSDRLIQLKEIENYMMTKGGKRLILPFRDYDGMQESHIFSLCYFLIFGIYGKSLSVNLYRSLFQYGKCFKEKRDVFYKSLMFTLFEIPYNSDMIEEALRLERELVLEPVFGN